MPELPEVEIVRRALEPVMVGLRVERLVFNRPNLRFALPQPLPADIAGARVTQLMRRGKYIIGLASEACGFVLHLGMSGVVRIEPAGDVPVRLKHDHVEFYMDGGARIILNDARRFGFLDAVNPARWNEYPALAKMGVEPLGNDFHGRELYEALQKSKSPIKVALLNQSVVAGLGNIYVCEALFAAGISPFRMANSLNEDECETLVVCIRAVLLRAIDAGGSSLKDYKHTDGKLGYFQHEFSVYGQVGRACKGCDCDIMKTGGVKKAVQAGRSTFYCARKQRVL